MVLLYASRPGVIRSQGLNHVKVVALQQFPQIFRSPFDIRLGIECIRHAELRSRPGHQLHKSLRSLGRHGPRVETTLRLDHAVHQIRIQPIPPARRIDHVVQIHRASSRKTRFREDRRRGCPISRVICEKACPELVEGWGLRLIPGSRKPRIRSRHFRRSLKMFNLRRGHIHKTRSIRSHIQPRSVADHFPPFMPDGKSIPQHRNLARKAGKRRHRENREDAQTQPN